MTIVSYIVLLNRSILVLPMKIRIRANSIRFRLTKSEVEQLCTAGSVEESTAFLDKTFGYGVRISSEFEQLHASFKDNHITLYLPKTLGKDWYTNDQVGFEHTIELPEQQQLSLLLEKDFTCLSPRGEDETDNYMNPKAVE